MKKADEIVTNIDANLGHNVGLFCSKPKITVKDLTNIMKKNRYTLIRGIEDGLSYSHKDSLFISPTKIPYTRHGMSYREVDQLIAISLHISDKSDWVGSKLTVEENSMHNFSYFIEIPKFFYYKDLKIIVTIVATDNEMGDESVGEERSLRSLLTNVLGWADAEKKDWEYILMPIGQMNKYSGVAGKIMGTKHHFTHLTIKKTANKYEVKSL